MNCITINFEFFKYNRTETPRNKVRYLFSHSVYCFRFRFSVSALSLLFRFIIVKHKT